MTTHQEQIIVIALLLALLSVAGVATLCHFAPLWTQEEEDVSGSFYVKPLGGDHE